VGWSWRIASALFPAVLVAAAWPSVRHPSLPSQASAPAAPRVTTFPLTHVRLLDGPFQRAQELNSQYIRALEVDRLLAPFRSDAGLPKKAEPYPNWESSGLGGHTAGHYLTALAQAWAATGDAEASWPSASARTRTGMSAESRRAASCGPRSPQARSRPRASA
jgi:beta-L-arabinofuranosidase (glycosyl hydrolase family 127)